MARTSVCTWLLFFFLLGFSTTLQAQSPGGVPPVAGAPDTQMGMDARLGYGMLGEDHFLTIAPGFSFGFGKIKFGIQAPLRIRLIDNKPKQNSWVREEDWDEPSDWTRILRFFQYGEPRDVFYLRLGELVASSIGHGTIIHRYYNTLELDHYHTGLSTKLNLEDGGVEFLTNDVLSWNMVGLRGYIYPFKLLMDNPHWLLKRLAVGTTFASDFIAPWELTMETDGAGTHPRVDSTNSLDYKARVAWFWGLDLELRVVDTKTLYVTPYTDFNVFAGQGVGWHLGVLNGLRWLDSEFELRLEYRLVGAGYAPSYFNTLYDLERLQFLPLASGGQALTKYRYYEEADLDLIHGFYGELYMNILGLVGIGGSYEDYQGDDNASVTLRLDLPEIARVKLAAYYARRNFDGFSELFSLDDAYGVAEARVKVAGPLFLFGIYSIHWVLNDDVTSSKYGEYEASDDFQVGAGVAFSF